MLCKIKVRSIGLVLLIICTHCMLYLYANKHSMLCTIKVRENKTSSYCFSYVLSCYLCMHMIWVFSIIASCSLFSGLYYCILYINKASGLCIENLID